MRPRTSLKEVTTLVEKCFSTGSSSLLKCTKTMRRRFAGGEPFLFDEFVLILSGKLILTNSDGVSQEYVAGDSLVVPKGYQGTWKMLGNYRELVVIERKAYEEAYGLRSRVD